jgi:preprotein translocase subunit Sec63
MLSRAAAGQPAFQPLISTRFFSFPKKYRRKRAPHKILGVAEDSTYDEIKSAYLQKAKELHPDRNPNSTEVSSLKKIGLDKIFSKRSSFWS